MKTIDGKSMLNFSLLLYVVTTTLILLLVIGILLLIYIDKISNIYESSKFNFEIPPADYHEIYNYKIDNGLEVVVIIDPLTKFSSASLSVAVGSHKDPKYLPGLAHYCEHMLFLGSYKYPNSLEYFKTVTENSGHFNAYTDRNITNYFFEVHNSAFLKTISIFSRFFIDPMLSEEYLKKEVNSINSEFEKNLILDNRKRSQISYQLSNNETGLNRFTTGNKETLFYLNSSNINYTEFNFVDKINVTNEIRKFYKENYTADKMKLVIFTSKEDYGELKNEIISKFKYIPKPKIDTTLNKTINNQPSSLIDSKYKGSFIKYESYSSQNELIFKFEFPNCDLNDCFYNNPFEYFSFVIENKDIGGLMQNLKNLKLATSVIVSKEGSLKWNYFNIKINLTKEGKLNIPLVLIVLDKYLEFLKTNLIREDIYNILQSISKISFNILDYHKNSLTSITSALSAKLQTNYKSHIFDSYHFINSFNKTLYQDLVNYLNIQNSLIFFPKQNEEIYEVKFDIFNLKNNSFDPWYKTNYTIYSINYNLFNNDKSYLGTYLSKNNKTLTFSVPNLSKYKSINDKLVDVKTFSCFNNNIFLGKENTCYTNLQKYQDFEPILLINSPLIEVWHKKFYSLDFMKTQIVVFLENNYSLLEFPDISVILKLQFLEMIVKKKLKTANNELLYYQNSIKVSSDKNGLKLTLFLFSTLQQAYLSKTLDVLSNIILKKEISIFENLKEEIKNIYTKESKLQPYQTGYKYIKKSLFKGYFLPEEYLSALEKINKNSIINFLTNYFQMINKIKISFVGEMTENSAKLLTDQFQNDVFFKSYQKSISKKNSKIKAPNKDINSKLSNKLLLMPGKYLTIKQNKDSPNNAIVRCMYIGDNTISNKFKLQVLNSIIGNIVFQEIRIKNQMGYIAKNKGEEIENLLFFCMHVQGSKESPLKMDKAIIKVTHKILKILHEIDEFTFNRTKQMILDLYTGKSYKLSYSADVIFNQIEYENYNFQYFLKLKDFVKTFKKTNLIEFWETISNTSSNNSKNAKLGSYPIISSTYVSHLSYYL